MTAREAFPGVGLLLAVGLLLFWTQPVLKPLALAALLALILSPCVKALETWGLGRVPATTLVASLALLAIAACGAAVAYQFVALATDLAGYERTLQEKLATLGASDNVLSRLARIVSTALDSAGDLLLDAPAPTEVVVVSGPLERLHAALTPWAAAAGTAGIVIVLCVFFLLRRDDLSDRIVKLAGHRRIGLTTRALDEAGRRISRYLSVFSAINLAYGAAVAGGLALIGLPLAFLWGALAGVLRFIPYIGAALGFLGPVVLATVVFPGWEPLLLIVLLFASLEAVLVGAVEPLLYGRSTGVSPIALLVSALFWTWLWGPLGLLLSTPLTVSLAVAGKYVPGLSGIGTLLSDSPGLRPPLRLYQRLLAGDTTEARAMLERAQKTGGLEHALNALLHPALGLAARDARAGDISQREGNRVLREMDDLIDELEWKRQVQTGIWAPGRDLPTDAVLAIARDDAEHLVIRMFNLLLELPRTPLVVVRAEQLRNLDDELATRRPPALIYVRREDEVQAQPAATQRLADRAADVPRIALDLAPATEDDGGGTTGRLSDARDRLLSCVQTDADVRNELRHAVQSGHVALAENTLRRVMRSRPFDRVHVTILGPLLQASPDAEGLMPEAQARLRSFLRQTLRGPVTAVRETTADEPRVLVACPEDRDDGVEGLLLTLSLRARGWDVLFIGNAVPPSELVEVARELRPRVTVLLGPHSIEAAHVLANATACFVRDADHAAPRAGVHQLPRDPEGALRAIDALRPLELQPASGAPYNLAARTPYGP